jgi:hypothetical protein
MDNIVNSIVTEIVENHLEVEIYNILHTIILAAYKKETNKNYEQQACLTAIRKINQGKNEAIDALCDTEN